MIQEFPLHQRILFLGLGREARSTWHYLQSLPEPLADEIWLADEKPLTELAEHWLEIAGDCAGHFILGELDSKSKTNKDLPKFDVIIKSPGIPLEKITQDYGLKIEKDTLITSNTQLFLEWVATWNQSNPQETITTIGVTGTKGKSTTTALIQAVLEADGSIHSLLGGNIGIPPLDLVAHFQKAITDQKSYRQRCAVLELSSHQLAELTLSPSVAVVQAVTPEHLDYYGSFEEYLEAKTAITRYQQQNDVVFFNADNREAAQIAALSSGKQIPFGLLAQNDFSVTDTEIRYQDQKIVSPEKLKLPGKHNLLNVLPAIAIGKRFNIPLEKVRNALLEFKELPHRLAFVAEKNSIRCYNDSLATNPEATVAALKSFEPGQVILIAGGFDRGLDFGQLGAAIISRKVKALVLFPETGENILAAVKKANPQLGTIPHFHVTTMTAAVQIALEQATKDNIILLSPASPSFNLFTDYADRGEQFVKAVTDNL